MWCRLRSFALCMALLSTSVATLESSEAIGRRAGRGSTTSKPARPERTAKPAEATTSAPTLVTLPGGTSQVIPNPTQCVLQTAHKYHPGWFIGGRIDRAGSGRARIQGPIIKRVKKAIAEAQDALAIAMSQALEQMRADMISQMLAGFQLGGLAIGCDAVLAKFEGEALRKCELNRSRFLSEARAQCGAGKKTPEERDACNCLVGPVVEALVQNCSLLAQSPEIKSAVLAAHANCVKNGATMTQVGQTLSGALSQLTGQTARGSQE